MKRPMFYRMCLAVFFLFAVCGFGIAQQPETMNAEVTANEETGVSQETAPVAVDILEVPAVDAAVESAGETVEEEMPKSDLITLDFKEANIRDVLKVISYKSGVNIVASPEVAGTVNVRITDVPWEKALDVILKTYGYAYDKQGNIIMVAPLEKLTAQRKMEQDLAQVQPVTTEVVILQYIDAIDAQKAIEPQLSPRGKITILQITGQAGWGFGGAFSEKKSRTIGSTSRSKTMIISDIPPVLDRIKEVLKSIDVKPKQVLIETRIVEVSLDKLRDIGVDFATGGAGSSSSTAVTTDSITQSLKAGGHSYGGVGITPAAFSPQATAITTANTGMNFVFQKLSGSQFEITIHALEENVATNILSAPSILTLDNQEATILIGEQFPIVSTTKSSDTSTTVDVSLESYKDIGIQLNVIPQVSGKGRDYINMIVHPAVTDEGTLIENRYPRITTREAQTQVLMKSGETIVIGGLIKDQKDESVQGVPFLRKIPFIGKLFERTTVDTEKIELLIFITAHIVDDRELTGEELATLEKSLGFRQAAP